MPRAREPEELLHQSSCCAKSSGVSLCAHYPPDCPGIRRVWVHRALCHIGPARARGRHERAANQLNYCGFIAGSFSRQPPMGPTQRPLGSQTRDGYRAVRLRLRQFPVCFGFPSDPCRSTDTHNRLPVADADEGYARKRYVCNHACQQRLHGRHYNGSHSHQGHGCCGGC